MWDILFEYSVCLSGSENQLIFIYYLCHNQKMIKVTKINLNKSIIGPHPGLPTRLSLVISLVGAFLIIRGAGPKLNYPLIKRVHTSKHRNTSIGLITQQTMQTVYALERSNIRPDVCSLLKVKQQVSTGLFSLE